MKKRFLLLSLILSSGQLIYAQSLTAVTGLRLYEHHSPAIAGSQGANGVQSAYDFVQRRYFNSFNASTFGEYINGEEANIDLAEHNGPYGNGGKFGFTSGVSTIWSGEIKGNGVTKWMPAPAGFNYATISTVSNISSAYNSSTAVNSIAEVTEGAVYLGKIRNTSLYVAMRCFNVKNKATGNNDVYFDFEYKYGTLAGTGVGSVEEGNVLSVYPNPAGEKVQVKNTLDKALTAKIVAMNGQTVQSFTISKNGAEAIDLSNVSSGIYFIIATAADGHRYTQKLVKQ